MDWIYPNPISQPQLSPAQPKPATRVCRRCFQAKPVASLRSVHTTSYFPGERVKLELCADCRKELLAERAKERQEKRVKSRAGRERKNESSMEARNEMAKLALGGVSKMDTWAEKYQAAGERKKAEREKAADAGEVEASGDGKGSAEGKMKKAFLDFFKRQHGIDFAAEPEGTG